MQVLKALVQYLSKKATQYTLPVEVTGHTKKHMLQLNLSLLQLLGLWQNSLTIYMAKKNQLETDQKPLGIVFGKSLTQATPRFHTFTNENLTI